MYLFLAMQCQLAFTARPLIGGKAQNRAGIKCLAVLDEFMAQPAQFWAFPPIKGLAVNASQHYKARNKYIKMFKINYNPINPVAQPVSWVNPKKRSTHSVNLKRSTQWSTPKKVNPFDQPKKRSTQKMFNPFGQPKNR